MNERLNRPGIRRSRLETQLTSDQQDQDHAEDAEEQALVRRAQEGDREAVEALVRRYQKMVFTTAYQFCGFQLDDAQDAAQEAFLRVFQKISQFEGRSSFSTWLYRIVVNTCLYEGRKKRRWQKILMPWRFSHKRDKDDPTALENRPDSSQHADPTSVLRGRELGKDVVEALEDLPDKQRMVFQLKVFQEMSIPEIAEVTGLAEGTVKSHLFRATQALRRRLGEWVEK
jgi:RNA polymerase sigma-70 factor (ECF subfamily)